MESVQHRVWPLLAEQPGTVLAFLCLLAVVYVVVLLNGTRRNKNLQKEHEQLLQDVAHLTLEKEQLEEDTLHLIEKNYNLTQRTSALRKRNLCDVTENNQLFHDVALLTLEMQEIQERNKTLQTENQNLLQTVNQLSSRNPPERSEEVSEMWQNYAALLEENDNLRNQCENLRRQKERALQYHQTTGRANGPNKCPLS